LSDDEDFLFLHARRAARLERSKQQADTSRKGRGAAFPA
jgi:hypothetical protein